MLLAKDDLKLLVLLRPPPKCWNYKYAPPWLVYVMLGIKSSVLDLVAMLPSKPGSHLASSKSSLFAGVRNDT